MSTQMFEVTIVATGEVRDAEGNLVSQQPIEAKAVITEEQARALVEGQDQ